MVPGNLKLEQFAAYPPQARQLIAGRLDLLRLLPIAFVPLLLREVIGYDWKFPAERKDLDDQFRYLGSLGGDAIRELVAPFARLRLSPELERLDWVNEPAQFSEELTAHLWATHQIDGFRTAAVDYVQRVNAASPAAALEAPRLTVVLIGQGVRENHYRLFRKLRPHGVYFHRLRPENGTRIVMDTLAARAAAHPLAFGHWYLDGGSADSTMATGVSCVSYRALDSVRSLIVNNMTRVMQSGVGPEALRTKLARMTPDELGMRGTGAEEILNRFQLSVLTEGSGTQIYSTTFVQWAARELLRRAQPVTLVARFAPRLREQSIKDLLAKERQGAQLDAEGSLRDGDMGAYYTWINLQRLKGANESRFVAWFEDHGEAVAIGPGMARGTESADAVDLRELLRRLG